MSETTKWTPAPWGNGETIEIRGQEEAGISVAFLNCEPGSPRDIQARANAHLIASAPELYAALDRAQRILDQLGRPKTDEGRSAVVNAWAEVIAAELDARKALAKARGES